MKRSTLYALPLAVGVVVALTLALIQPRAQGSNLAVPEGGTFRISLAAGSGIDYIDPALAYTPAAWALLDTVCARLLAYPDKRPPAGLRPVPEVAVAPPKVSRDLRTYTFTLRTGFRFSDGTPVRASAFARAINRTLAPGVASPGAQLTRDIVGAADVLAGRTRSAAGVVGQGEHARRPIHEAGVRLRGSDDVVVLLCGAADAALGRRGLRRLPGRRAVLRRRLQARRTRRDQAEPLLRGIEAAPRRRLRRRPPRLLAAGDAHACQAGGCRLGAHRRRHLLRSFACSRLQLTASIVHGSSSSPA